MPPAAATEQKEEELGLRRHHDHILEQLGDNHRAKRMKRRQLTGARKPHEMLLVYPGEKTSKAVATSGLFQRPNGRRHALSAQDAGEIEAKHLIVRCLESNG